jgi:hypothetical protein
LNDNVNITEEDADMLRRDWSESNAIMTCATKIVMNKPNENIRKPQYQEKTIRHRYEVRDKIWERTDSENAFYCLVPKIKSSDRL